MWLAIMLVLASCIAPPEKGKINLDGEEINASKTAEETIPPPVPGTLVINTPANNSYLPLNRELSFTGECSPKERALIVQTVDVKAVFVCPVENQNGDNLSNSVTIPSSVPDGTYTLSFLFGPEDNRQIVERTFIIDTQPPTAFISSPSNGSTINFSDISTFTVSGTCTSQDGTDVVLTPSQGSAQTVQCNSNTFTSSNFNLSGATDGEITFTTTATDLAGNTSSPSTVTFNLDKTPPVLAFTNPDPSATPPLLIHTGNHTSVRLTGTCDTPGITVEITGGSYFNESAVCSTGSSPYIWSKFLDFSGYNNGVGVNQDFIINIDSTDFAGNDAVQKSLTVRLENDTDPITISAPTQGFLVNNSNKASVSVSGTCIYDKATYPNSSVSLSGAGITTTSFDCNTNSWTGTLDMSNAIDNDNYVLTATHTDGNNSYSKEVLIQLDVNAPTLSVTSPLSSPKPYVNFNNQSTFAISGECSEAAQNITISGDVAASSPTCNGTNWNAQLDFSDSGILEGNISISLLINDVAGNSTSINYELIKDITRPTASFTTPSDQTHFKQTITLQGECSEQNKEVKITTPGLDPLIATCDLASTPKWSLINADFSSLDDGAIVLELEHIDSAGNETTSQVLNLTKDNIAPVVTIDSQDGLMVNAIEVSNFDISGTCVGAQDGQLIDLKIAGLSFDPTCTNEAWNDQVDLSSLDDGSYFIRAKVSDLAGNTSSEVSDSIILDTEAPVITFDSPAADSYIHLGNHDAFTLSGTCSEADLTITITGGDSVETTCSSSSPYIWSTNIDLSDYGSTVTDEVITINIDTQDVAGNAATQLTKTFKLTNTVPTLTITAPLADAYVNLSNKSTFAISGTCSFDWSDVVVSGDGLTNKIIDCNLGNWSDTLDLSGLDDTNNPTDLTLSFVHGPTNNTVSQDIPIKYDYTSPTLSVTDPAQFPTPAINLSNQNSFALSGDCSEEGQTITLSGDLPASTTTTCNTGDTWSLNIDFSTASTPASGTISIDIDMSDLAGNPATKVNYILNKDVTSPSLAFTSPNDNSYINENNYNSMTFQGNCSEEGQTITLDGADNSPLTATCFTANTPQWQISGADFTSLAEAAFTVTAQHSDTAGNPISAVLNLTKDITDPSLAITGSDGPLVSSSEANNFSINGSCDEDGLPITIDISTVNASVDCAGTTWSTNIDISALPDGEYAVDASFSDLAGNTTSASDTITLDKVGPTLLFATPSDGSNIGPGVYKSFPVKGTCSEPNINVTIDGDNNGIATAICHAPLIVLVNETGVDFTNETHDSLTSVVNDIALLPAGSDSDEIYFAKNVTFRDVTVDVSTVGVGDYTLSWQYWDGSTWQNLSVTDNTNNFKTAGSNTVTFTAPGDWATTIVDSQGPYYYIRAVVDSGTRDTLPLAAKIYNTDGSAPYQWAVNLNFSNYESPRVTNQSVTMTTSGNDEAGNTSPGDSRTFNLTTFAQLAVIEPIENGYVNIQNQSNFNVSGICSSAGSAVDITEPDSTIVSVGCNANLEWSGTLNLTEITDGASDTITFVHLSENQNVTS